MLSISRVIFRVSVFLTMLFSAALAQANEQISQVNPLRLGYVNGDVSFWRYGAEDWVKAQINIPLTPGDALYTGSNAELELQAEGRAFIRADSETQISVVNQTTDFLQLKVTSGRVSLDLRTLPSAGYTIELDTPNAVFTIDHTGYYRVDVNSDVHFITRRGGRAVMTLADRESMSILPSEEIVVHGNGNAAKAETYAAPELDDWDLWNYDRTNYLVDTFSERYLSSGIAGARDLDYYGSWRISDEYGPVWVPYAMAADWAPYSTGRWIWDPYYQWTWVDDAPWGWAPFHYGRWVYFGGYWAWAPGPVVIQRPVYAPALVAFYSVTPTVAINISFSGSGLGWVALSWGEPLVPWWGRSGFVGRPWWGGWGGPRVVNNVIVKQTTVVNVTSIVYANRRVPNALIATTPEQFGRSHMHEASVRLQERAREMKHIRGVLPVKPDETSLIADAPKGTRPPIQLYEKPVVSTRKPPGIKLPWSTEKAESRTKEPRYVPAPKPDASGLRRPDIGTEAGAERARPQPLQPYSEWKRQPEPATSPAAARDKRSNEAESRPSRSAPSEEVTSPQRRDVVIPDRERAPASPVPQRQMQRREATDRQPIRSQQPVDQAPARGEAPSTPAKTMPQQRKNEAEQQPIQRGSGRANLPGIPANRTYRRGGQNPSEK